MHKNEKWKDEFFSLLMSRNATDYDKAIAKKRENMPKKLYRYRSIKTGISLARVLHSICSGEIYCARNADLNDPFEMRSTLSSEKSASYFEASELLKASLRKSLSKSFDREVLDKALNCCNWYDEIVKLVFGETSFALDISIMPEIEKSNESFNRIFGMNRVACFSEAEKNLPMWAHYSDENQGICLEYDISCLNQTTIDALFPVKYTCELQDALKLAFEQGRNENLPPMGFDQYFCTQKLCDWSYEKEWRYIFHPGMKYSYNAIPSDYSTRGEEVFFGKPSKILIGNKTPQSIQLELCRIAYEQDIMVAKMEITQYGLEESLIEQSI